MLLIGVQKMSWDETVYSLLYIARTFALYSVVLPDVQRYDEKVK